jgi:hypothetical protein
VGEKRSGRGEGSKVAFRPVSRVSKNGSDAFKNARIIFKSIFTPSKDPSFSRNAETVSGNIYRPSTCLILAR